MSAEDDPQAAAKRERKTPEVERLLRQFLRTDGPAGHSEAYREAYARIFEKDCAHAGERTFSCDRWWCADCGKDVQP